MIKTVGRKNYASMARSNDLSYEEVFIKKEEVKNYLDASKKFVKDTIKNLATAENMGILIVDFTLLKKQFAKDIPSLTYDYNGIDKCVSKGISAGFIVWSNGAVTIPFDYILWQRKKDAGESYKKKTELAKDLIRLAKEYGIPFAEVKLDGAFSSYDMLKSMTDEHINYIARMPSNRFIETTEGRCKISDHYALKMRKNEKYKMIKCFYKGIPVYIIAYKRNGKNGTKEIIYLVSNINRSPEQHVVAFEGRWVIEKHFRTTKQSIGLADCQSIDAEKQQLHIFLVMATYTVLQLIKFDKKKSSVEDVLNLIRFQKTPSFFYDYFDLDRDIMC